MEIKTVGVIGMGTIGNQIGIVCPLAAANAAGLDITLNIMRIFHKELGDKYRPAPLLVKLVKARRLGRKSGRGVYNYTKQD